ncbi:MAG: hypothetical protein V4653_06610 [Pseudomonadota bacterium]
MNGSLSFAARLATVLAGMLMLGCGLAVAMNVLKFERLLLEQQARVLEIVAGDLGETLENGLALGVRLATIPGAQALLERARSAEPLIAGLSVVDAHGAILFDTDRQRLGGTAPELARAGISGAWRFRDGARHNIGVPIVNGHGQSEGGLLLSYTRAAVDEQLVAALLAMISASLVALALAVPLSVIGVHVLTQQTRRWFARIEAAMQPNAAQEPCAVVLQAAIAEASAILEDAEQRLEAGAAEEVEA